uniref:Rhodanese domain-containing protein n=1 Tax=Callorhinchus milii TaxID=7868 RepID=A0A4W3IY81_CALMI
MLKPVSEWIKHSFQTVENVSSDSLEQLLKEDRDRVVLVDARSQAEYEVSHIEGAVRVDPDASNMDNVVQQLGLPDVQKENKTVVCYCTVGYHGSQMAQKLSGFLANGSGRHEVLPRVYNLEGGLVKWANERKEIVDGRNKPTALVHPYNQVWGQLLEPELRASF